MPSKGFGSMFNSGPAFDVVKSAKKAQEIGRQMVDGTGPVGVTMKTLGLWDHFQEIGEDIEKLEKMEKRLHERLDLAETSLENARRSPYLKNVGSVDLLEGTVVDSWKYLKYVESCGPLLRGAAHDEMIAKLGNMLIWVTDSLVALQLDTMLAVTNGDANSNVQQVDPEGHNPGDGGAPNQGVGPENQGGCDMMGQHPQQVLMPPPTYPELPHSHPHLHPQRMVPMGNMLGMPQIPPGPIVHTASRVTGAFAMPNGGAGWTNNAQGGPSMMMHQPPPMPAGPPIAYGGIGWPNNSGATYCMRPHTPSTAGVHPGFNRDGGFRATPHPPPMDAGRENSRAMWPSHGDPPSFRSLPATESIGDDGPTSPVPSDASSETARKVAWVDADSARLPHPAFSTSQDAKSNDGEGQSDGPDTRSPHFDPAFHMKHQTRPVPHAQDAQLPHPPDTSSHVPQIVYDNIGRLYYVDPNTGHRYPAGWGHQPHIR